MRKYLVLLTAGVCLLVLAPGAASLASGSTHYAGKNSQGQPLSFTVNQTTSGPVFVPVTTSMTDRCPVTGTTIGLEIGFSGLHVPIKNGKFTLVANNLDSRFRWSGTIAATKASGTESFQLPAFDTQGGLQDCATGSLSWTAQAAAAAAPHAATGTSYVIQLIQAPDGSVRYSITH